MVYEETHDPCNSKLEENDQYGKFFTLYFSVDRCDCCSTWNIKQTKYHQCIGIGRSKPKGAECSDHRTHPICGRNVLHPE